MAVIEIGGILAKRCKGCEVTKEIDRFHSDASSNDGCSSHCADCRNARKRARRAHRNRNRKKSAQYVLTLALRSIKVRGPSTLFLGVCTNVDEAISAMGGVDRRVATDAKLAMRDLMVKWPGGTGSGAFPVPHPSALHGQAYAGQAYTEHSLGGLNMWDRETEYGASRWALLEWMIEQLPEVA